MIIDKLENLKLYASLNPLFPKVLEFLQQHDLNTLEEGKHEIVGKDLFVNQVCMSFCVNLPNILLGTLSGSTAAGLYDAAGKLHNAGKHTIDVLNRTFFPFLSRRMDKHNSYRRINFVFSLLLALLLFVLAPFLVRLLYSDEFLPAIPLLRILAVSVFFTGISSAYGVNYLLLVGREKLLRNITLTVTLIGVVLFVVMTSLYETTGASLAVVLINAGFAISYFIAARRCPSSNEQIKS